MRKQYEVGWLMREDLSGVFLLGIGIFLNILQLQNHISILGLKMEQFFIDFDKITGGSLLEPLKSRRQQAIQYYQALQKRLNQCQQLLPSQQIYDGEEKQGRNFKDYQCKANMKSQSIKGVSNQHNLLILQGLSLGNHIGKTQKNNPILHHYPMAILRNLPKVALLKLSKIFVQLLPKKRVIMSPLSFYQKYFRTHEMLRFYHQHNINLIQTFHDLFFIKDWQIKNNEYLKRGYALDYLPQEISLKLAALPKVYDEIEYIYNTFGYKIKTREKRKKRESKHSDQKPLTQIHKETQKVYDNTQKIPSSTQQDDFFLSENE